MTSAVADVKAALTAGLTELHLPTVRGCYEESARLASEHPKGLVSDVSKTRIPHQRNSTSARRVTSRSLNAIEAGGGTGECRESHAICDRVSASETNQTLRNLRSKAMAAAPSPIMVIVAGSGTGEGVASAPDILGWRRS